MRSSDSWLFVEVKDQKREREKKKKMWSFDYTTTLITITIGVNHLSMGPHQAGVVNDAVLAKKRDFLGLCQDGDKKRVGQSHFAGMFPSFQNRGYIHLCFKRLCELLNGPLIQVLLHSSFFSLLLMPS